MRNTIMFTAVLLNLGACAPTRMAPVAHPELTRLPRFVLQTGADGQKTVYPVESGLPNEKKPITPESEWTAANPPVMAYVTCYTFKANHGGSSVCGVACSNGSTYRMGCNADIFAGGFDKEWTE